MAPDLLRITLTRLESKIDTLGNTASEQAVQLAVLAHQVEDLRADREDEATDYKQSRRWRKDVMVTFAVAVLAAVSSAGQIFIGG